MKIFSIRNDFSVSDLSDEEDASIVVDKINIESNPDVQLNLSGCLIDYPATSKLVDNILDQLALLPGKKYLEIVTDFNLPKQTVMNWLFLGSRRLDMESKKGLSYDDLIKTIQYALLSLDISLRILIIDNTGNKLHEVAIP